MLRTVLGPNLMSRYSSGVTERDLRELADLGGEELLDSTPENIEQIAASMIKLGAALHTATSLLADDLGPPTTIRDAARMAADAAEIVHTHYGGDSGGW